MKLEERLREKCKHTILLYKETCRNSSGSEYHVFTCCTPPEYERDIKYCEMELVRKNPPTGYQTLEGWSEPYFIRIP